MARSKDQPELAVPPQTHTVTWARMLGVARVADTMEADGAHNLDADPLTTLRLKSLLPIARALYDDKVLPTVNNHLERVKVTIMHCREIVRVKEARKSPAFKQGAKEKQWTKEDCLRQMQSLLIPATPRTLRPRSPDMIGVLLIPQSPVWWLLCKAIMADFSKPDKRQIEVLKNQVRYAINCGKLQQSDLEPLHGVRLVDTVLDWAPPLVRALPSTWTAADSTDEFLEALQALLQVAGTRPLVELVERLSYDEYVELTEERDYLSQLLDAGTWESSRANGRNIDEYVEFVRYLGKGASLQLVPQRLERRIVAAVEPSSTQPVSVAVRQAFPPMDTAAWVRMLAAARAADKMETDAGPLTMARLKLLYPVARALYQEKLLPTAKAESELIDVLIDAQEQWNEGKCLQEMRNLLAAATFKTLRPASPAMIGVQLIPFSSVWRPLHLAIFGGFSEADKYLTHAFRILLFETERNEERIESAKQLLGSVRFVDIVFGCAPPLVRALPQRWTSGELSNELLEALQALLKMAGSRPLVELVELLSENEYALVVDEHDCLSRLLDGGTWAPKCDNGRNRYEYVAFVRFLQTETLNTLLEPVPKRLGQSGLCPEALYSPQLELKDAASMLQAPPRTDTAAWARMLAAARGADEMDALDAQADPLSMSRLETLLPIARALYEENVHRTATTLSQQIDNIIRHCRKFLEAKESRAARRGVEEPWSEYKCANEMEQMLVPATFKTLRPATPEAIAVQLIPPSAVWLLFRKAIYPDLSPAQKSQSTAFGLLIA